MSNDDLQSLLTVPQVTVTQAKARLSGLIDDVRTGKAPHVIICRRNKPAAVLLALDRFRELEKIEEDKIQRDLEEAFGEFPDPGSDQP